MIKGFDDLSLGCCYPILFLTMKQTWCHWLRLFLWSVMASPYDHKLKEWYFMFLEPSSGTPRTPSHIYVYRLWYHELSCFHMSRQVIRWTVMISNELSCCQMNCNMNYHVITWTVMLPQEPSCYTWTVMLSNELSCCQMNCHVVTWTVMLIHEL